MTSLISLSTFVSLSSSDKNRLIPDCRRDALFGKDLVCFASPGRGDGGGGGEMDLLGSEGDRGVKSIESPVVTNKGKQTITRTISSN